MVRERQHPSLAVIGALKLSGFSRLGRSRNQVPAAAQARGGDVSVRPDDQREGKLAEQAWDLREYDLRHSADPRDWVILRHPNSQEAVDAG